MKDKIGRSTATPSPHSRDGVSGASADGHVLHGRDNLQSRIQYQNLAAKTKRTSLQSEQRRSATKHDLMHDAARKKRETAGDNKRKYE